MNIRVDLNTPITDGTEVVFRSPVDCSQVTGLKVYNKNDGSCKEFAFADAHGNNVGDIDHLFAENVVVKVILDVTTGMAFVQNADTNAYLEGRFAGVEKSIEDILAEIHYQNISLTAFSCPGAGTYEMGKSVAAPTITWGLNKEPASQSINGETLGVAVRSKAYSGSITSNKTYTLTVKGQKGETATKSGSYTFYNGVYYGVLYVGDTIDSATIRTLTRELRGDFKKTYPVIDAGSKQRHAFAFPTRYGTPTFKDADTNLGADFYKAATFLFTNGSGYAENYDVWLATNPELGSLKVTIS